MTGFFEEVTKALMISSSFIGLNDMGFALAIIPLYRKLLGLTKLHHDDHIGG
jgi:hypothetical protein